jgi:hypothetical protein
MIPDSDALFLGRGAVIAESYGDLVDVMRFQDADGKKTGVNKGFLQSGSNDNPPHEVDDVNQRVPIFV